MRRGLVWACVATLLAYWSGLTVLRNGDWMDEERLFIAAQKVGAPSMGLWGGDRSGLSARQLNAVQHCLGPGGIPSDLLQRHSHIRPSRCARQAAGSAPGQTSNSISRHTGRWCTRSQPP